MPLLPARAQQSEPLRLQHLVMIWYRPSQAPMPRPASASVTSACVAIVSVASLQTPGASVAPLELAPSCTQYASGANSGLSCSAKSTRR